MGESSMTMPATMTRDGETLVFALATLGGATEIEMILSVSRDQRWPKQVKCLSLSLTFSSKNCCLCTQASEWYLHTGDNHSQLGVF